MNAAETTIEMSGLENLCLANRGRQMDRHETSTESTACQEGCFACKTEIAATGWQVVNAHRGKTIL